MSTLLIVLVIALPWLGALAVVCAGNDRPRAQHALAVGFSVAGGLSALGLLPFASASAVIRVPIGGIFGDISFVPDGFGVLLAAIASVIGSLTVIFSVDYMRGEAQLGRYYALVLLFIGAMAGLVLTGSLLLLFFFWELVAFCSYALISFHNDDPKAVYGGLKALVITQIGGIGLLIGVLVAYSSLGSYDINQFLANAHTLPPLALGIAAFGFLVAAAAKSAQVPFHTWLPDAMEAPTPVSALIHAATMVNAGVYLLARFCPAFAAVPGWTTTVITIGIVSVLLAAFMALVATDLKRVLAYSTISQLGYMVYAVGVGAIFASQFHLLSHALFKALLFLGAGAVIHTVGTRDLRQMGGLGSRMPFVRNAFVIGGLALAGLPILNGFWSKETILEAGQAAGPWWPYQAMLFGVFVTAIYTLRVTWLVFYGKPRSQLATHETPNAMRLALGVLAVGALTSWLLAGPLAVLFASSLPYHAQHAETTLEMAANVIRSPGTAVALIVTLLALLVWQGRNTWLLWLVDLLRVPARAAASDFGFEWVNRRVMALAQKAAAVARTTQTGQLNWNAAGIVVGLLVVLVILTLGGTK